MADQFVSVLMEELLDEIATDEADKKVIAENPGIVEVVNEVHT